MTDLNHAFTTKQSEIQSMPYDAIAQIARSTGLIESYRDNGYDFCIECFFDAKDKQGIRVLITAANGSVLTMFKPYYFDFIISKNA